MRGFKMPPKIPGLPPGVMEGPPPGGAIAVAAPLNDLQLQCLMAATIHADRVDVQPDDPAGIRSSALIAIELFANVVVLNQSRPAVGLIFEAIRKRENPTPSPEDDEAEARKRAEMRAQREGGLKIVEGESGA